MEGEKFKRNDVDVHHFDKDLDTVVLSWINEKTNIDNIYKKNNDKSDENCDRHFNDKELINDFIEYHNCNSKLLLLFKKGHKKFIKIILKTMSFIVFIRYKMNL